MSIFFSYSNASFISILFAHPIGTSLFFLLPLTSPSSLWNPPTILTLHPILQHLSFPFAPFIDHIYQKVYFFENKLFLFFNCILGFGVHVKNMQDCCIGTCMAVWCAAFLPITYIWHFSPCYLPPTPHPPLSLTYFPPTDPSMWCSPPCVHVFSLFNTCLWVRTCGISL